MKTSPKLEWFVMRGFNQANKDDVGFLGMDKSKKKHQSVYKIVDSPEDAMKFPSININNTASFGTPKQWLEFFKGEDELSNWKFHLVKVKNEQSPKF